MEIYIVYTFEDDNKELLIAFLSEEQAIKYAALMEWKNPSNEPNYFIRSVFLSIPEVPSIDKDFLIDTPSTSHGDKGFLIDKIPGSSNKEPSLSRVEPVPHEELITVLSTSVFLSDLHKEKYSKGFGRDSIKVLAPKGFKSRVIERDSLSYDTTKEQRVKDCFFIIQAINEEEIDKALSELRVKYST